jgi:endonuclease/exonuclease/phosphatase (EEP) superfamily protein YafD
VSLPHLGILPPAGLPSISLWSATAIYLAVVLGWLLFRRLFDDRWPWLFVLNSLSLYLFLPLPAALVVGLWTRNLTLLGGCVALLTVLAWMWGGLFLRKSRRAVGPTLTVMTYNVLGSNVAAPGVVDALTRSGADVIALQELNAVVAEAIRRDLIDAYPYQVLMPCAGASGMGLISRYPFSVIEAPLDDPAWIGPPIAVQVGFAGSALIVVSSHSASRANQAADRERQAGLLGRFAGTQALPVIVAGDFNATDRNRSYALMREHFKDAWRAAGRGFGHTFPGASKTTTPGSSRPDAFGVSAPQWLVRIDYVFYSRGLRAVEARTGPFDGHSDHRPVVAVLELD